MTFDQVQEEWFFDAFNYLKKTKDLTDWFDIDPVLQWAAVKITRDKADKLLKKFTEEIHYIEKNDEGKYQVSDSGKVYYEFLKKETDKYNLDSQSVKSTIKTGRLTRRNIRVGWGLGVATFLAVMANLGITIHKTNQDTERQKTEALERSTNKQAVPQLIQELHQISQSLQDTAKVKVKIEK